MSETITARTDIFGVPVDALGRKEALRAVVHRVKSNEPVLVVTPNTDHFMRWQKSPSFRRLYEIADLSIVDGAPLAWMARLLGHRSLERFPGVDLLIALLSDDQRPDLRIFVIGSRPEICDRAATVVQDSFVGASIVGHQSPAPDELENQDYLDDLCAELSTVQPNVVVIALGSPKQEALFARLANELPPACYMGLGASIDFIAGQIPRSPLWLRKIGAEWVYRLLREPQRLARRYLIEDLPVIKFLLKAATLRLSRSLRA